MIKSKEKKIWTPVKSHLEEWAKLVKEDPAEYEIYKKGVKEYQNKVRAANEKK